MLLHPAPNVSVVSTACPQDLWPAVLPCHYRRILVVSVTDYFLWRDHNFRLLVASFGASAVLLYGVPESKLSQPRNLIGKSVTRSSAYGLQHPFRWVCRRQQRRLKCMHWLSQKHCRCRAW